MAGREASLTCDGDGLRAVCGCRWSGSRAQLKRGQMASSSARQPPTPPSSKWASAGGRSEHPTGCGEASAAGHCARGSRQVPAPIADDTPQAGALAPASTPASAGAAHGGRAIPLLPPAQICCSNWLRSRSLMSTSQLMEWFLLPRRILQRERKIANTFSLRSV